MVYNQPKPSDKYRKSRRWVDKEQGLYGTYFQLEDEIFCVIDTIAGFYALPVLYAHAAAKTLVKTITQSES